MNNSKELSYNQLILIGYGTVTTPPVPLDVKQLAVTTSSKYIFLITANTFIAFRRTAVTAASSITNLPCNDANITSLLLSIPILLCCVVDQYK